MDIDRQTYMKDVYLNNPDIKLTAKLEVEYICKIISSTIEGLKNKRNLKIISYRCGFDGDFEIRSLEYVGDKFGLTRERIRQIMLRFYKLVKARDKIASNNLSQDKSLEVVVVRIALLAELAEFSYDDLRDKIFGK